MTFVLGSDQRHSLRRDQRRARKSQETHHSTHTSLGTNRERRQWFDPSPQGTTPILSKIAPTQVLQAAGLGRHDIAEYIVSEYPSCINMTDVDGRTPLHYASLLKDDGKMTTFLLDNGADESVLDNVSATIPPDPR